MPTTRTTAARILVVDDEPELLEILQEWFTLHGYEVRTAGNGFEALALARERPYDIVITDLKMPGMSGVELLDQLKALDGLVEVIFLTGQGTMEDAIAVLREGRAFDFLQKPLKNLRQLNLVIGKALARRHSARQATPGEGRAQVSPGGPGKGMAARVLPGYVEGLSGREVEIVGLLALGLDNREVAERLALSEKTVKNHLTRIYEKLKVKNRTQAVVFCQQHGLI